MTYRELLNRNKDLEDAKSLLFGLKHWKLKDFLASGDEPVNEAFLKAYEDAILRLKNDEPLEYILGETEFLGRTYLVNPDVLIPRLDTEILVLEAEKCIRAFGKAPKVLDLCTGSGIIGITLRLDIPESQVTLSDVSEKALTVAKENAERLGADAEILKSDLFEAFPLEERFDFIVSNPPYIASDVIETLDRSVKEYEPRLALDGDRDGLKFYRRIIASFGERLMPGGTVLFEIGDEQGEGVSALLAEIGYTDIRVVKDIENRDRVVIGKTQV